MVDNIWYELGIAFAAAKAVFKGAHSGFATLDPKEVQKITKFGDINDNYPYFCSLVSHVDKTNLTPLITVSIVSYYKLYIVQVVSCYHQNTIYISFLIK